MCIRDRNNDFLKKLNVYSAIMEIEKIIRDRKFDIAQMTALRRDGPGLPKLQEFINAAVDFSIAVDAKRDGPDTGEAKKANNVSFTRIDQEDLNDRVEEPLTAGPKGHGLAIKEEAEDDLQQSCSKVLSSRSTRT